MRLLALDRAAVVYAIGCELGLIRIGVAADAEQRRRQMQVGSPVVLELVGCYRFRTAAEAYAVSADLQRQLADRRVRGGWYRVSAEQLRGAVGNRSARQAPALAAEARKTAAAVEKEAARERREQAGERRRGRAQQRSLKLRALARLLAAGLTRRAAALELAVDERTLRRWAKLPAFPAELAQARARREREHERAQRRIQKRRDDTAGRRFARQNPQLYAQSGNPDMRPELTTPAKAKPASRGLRVSLLDSQSGEHTPLPPARAPSRTAVAGQLVRIESSDGRNRRWVEPDQLERFLSEGWQLVDKQS